jgi:hypothetical protein
MTKTQTHLTGLEQILQEDCRQSDIDTDYEEETESNNPETWQAITKESLAHEQPEVDLDDMARIIDASSQVITDSTEKAYRRYDDHFKFLKPLRLGLLLSAVRWRYFRHGWYRKNSSALKIKSSE